jgi:hypothetical protein
MTIAEIIAAAALGDASFHISAGDYIRSAICAMIVGVSFFVPTLVYYNDALPMGIRVLIHMGTGLIVYFPSAFIAGWIPISLGVGIIILDIVVMLVIAWIIWLCFYLSNKSMAKRINERIREKQA